ncbi:hypothetical protein F0U61_10690 [Archangium violaceum]|uniref:ADYC domain-containing protein n=1 Tax=Archangium violaceum TaxID=83451 RepID=UPI002B319CDE|nr:hypothetical protein F0U61_10690 [Archangium violaceum]
MNRVIAGSWKMGACLALLVLGSSVQAGDPPPENPTQGIRLHATGRFELINIPLASANTSKADEVHSQVRQTAGVSPKPPPPPRCGQNVKVERGIILAKDGSGRDCKPEHLVGTSFSAPLGGRLYDFTIWGARKVKGHASRERWEYQVKWSGDEGGGGNLCESKENWALAVPHTWTASGELRPNESYFTFACLPGAGVEYGSIAPGGVIAKCIDWGFPPWSTSSLPNVAENARQLHQACVRMATADYCGEGKANTLEGTPIYFLDQGSLPIEVEAHIRVKKEGRLPVYKLPPEADPEKEAPGETELEEVDLESLTTRAQGDFQFEALWGIDDCGRVQARCVSKTRWDSLAADGACGKLRPCGKMTRRQLQQSNVLFVSYSSPIDKGLYLFKHSGNKYLTTSSVKYDDKQSKLLPDIKDIKSAEYVRYLGPVLRSNRPPRPPRNTQTQTTSKDQTVDPNELKTGHVILGPGAQAPLIRCPDPLVGLHLCKEKSGNRIILSDRCEDDNRYTYYHGDPKNRAVEGYIYPPCSLVKSNPLYLWTDGAGNYVTSTQKPDGYNAPGRLLGFMPPLNDLAELYMR